MKETYKFCLELLKLGQHRCRAMANIVMGLCSSLNLVHPVELTNSRFCHYTYSNLTKVLSFWKLTDYEFLKFIKKYLPAEQTLSNGKQYRMLSHDLTKLLKPHSPCLPGRGYVVESNPVVQNLSLSAGYYVSALHINDGHRECAPPLMMKRLDVEMDKNAEILAQVATVMTHNDMPFKDMLTLFNGDTAYGKASIISPLHEYPKLIGVLRMRTGMKVWSKYKGEQKGNGAPSIYGEKYYLRASNNEFTDKKTGKTSIQLGINSLPVNEFESYETTMKNGRKIIIEIKRWNDLLIRSKGEAKMKDKPLDIVNVIIRDKETGKLVFDRPMYLSITGQSKQEVSCTDVQKSYLCRFDVEKTYRFSNQNLLMSSLQSPEIAHQDSWLNIVKICFWLLYVAAKEITKVDFQVWQKYLAVNKNEGKDVVEQGKVTLSQAQKSVHRLFCTFEKKLFLPQKCKKGKGRKEGTTFEPRKKHSIVRKSKRKQPIPT